MPQIAAFDREKPGLDLDRISHGHLRRHSFSKTNSLDPWVIAEAFKMAQDRRFCITVRHKGPGALPAASGRIAVRQVPLPAGGARESASLCRAPAATGFRPPPGPSHIWVDGWWSEVDG